MSKRYVLVKLLNLVLILAFLFTYQQIAEGRAAKEAQEISKVKKEAAAKTAQSKDAAAMSAYKDGVYEGTADGYGGPIVMKITIKDGSIKKAEAVSASGEDAAYWNMAKKIIPDIVSNQGPEVDTVSGATYSSNGIINASVKALQKAVR